MCTYICFALIPSINCINTQTYTSNLDMKGWVVHPQMTTSARRIAAWLLAGFLLPLRLPLPRDIQRYKSMFWKSGHCPCSTRWCQAHVEYTSLHSPYCSCTSQGKKDYALSRLLPPRLRTVINHRVVRSIITTCTLERSFKVIAPWYIQEVYVSSSVELEVVLL